MYKFMNYDQWKLATDRDNCNYMVTSCCGADDSGGIQIFVAIVKNTLMNI
jgi:hypothetical protein